MGLDITAYSHLKAVGKHTKDPALNEGEPGGLDDYCYYEHHVEAFAYDSFPASFRGIRVLDTRVLRDGDLILKGGCYEITHLTETHAFHAGSYTGYGRWRADLQAQFNPEPDPAGPFYELIWFADNEGTVGPDAAKNLLADFHDHADQYKGDDYAREKYQDWTRACELAAADGLIRFH